MATRRDWLALLLILAVAIWLRFWRLSFGLFEGSWFPDEQLVSVRTVAFGPRALLTTPPLDFIYGPLTSHLAGLAMRVAEALGLITGPLKQTTPQVLLIARGVSATAGVASVLIVFELARRAATVRTGLIAAALMAVTPFDAMYAHIASADVLLATCFTLATLASYRLATRGDASSALFAGAAVGLAVATKYTGAAALTTLAWAIAEQIRCKRSAGHAARLGLFALAGFAAAIAVLCLPYLLNAGQVLAAMRSELELTSVLASDSESYHLVPSLGWYGRPYLYQLVASLPYVLGWPLYLVAIVGVCVAIWRRDLADRIVLASVVPYFLVMGNSQVVYPRYLLPILPAMVVLAARALPAAGPARIGVFAGVLAYSFALTSSQIARLSWDQQREVADWLARYVESRSGEPVRIAVAVDPKPYFGVEAPLREAGVVYWRLLPGRWFEGSPDLLVIPEWREIAIRRDTPDSPAAAELDRLQSGEAGYREVARWRSRYLQRDLYTRLDPSFAGDLWQGEVGFAIYERSGEG